MPTGDIFLATGVITDLTLFQNGLHQNSLILYDLFETLGYRCLCLTDVSSEFITGYRHLQPEDYLNQENAYNPVFYIEIGLSLDSDWRGYLQEKGCKTAKLYLGNVLNIDIETVCMTPGLFFHHHVLGNLDYIWTSPHYKANCAWLSALHDRPCSVVPYLWSPKFIQEPLSPRGISLSPQGISLSPQGNSLSPRGNSLSPRGNSLSPRGISLSPRGISLSPLGNSFKSSGDIVIAEPNISFQKTALVPLLLAEAYYRENRKWMGKVYVQNSERLLVTPFWNRILEGLSLSRERRIVFSGRKSILELVQEHPGATFISHQLTNEYNYMTLELLWLNVPVLHNSDSWASYGHYYSVDKWPEAIQTLKGVLERDSEMSSEGLLWSVNPENPVNQEAWAKLLA